MEQVIIKIRGFTSHPLIKNSAIMFGGTMIANILAYAYHLVVGRIMGPVQYGELAALISVFYILNAPSQVLQNILVKFFSQLKAKQDYGQAKGLFWTIVKYLFVFDVIALVVLIPFTHVFAEFLHISSPIYFVWLFLTFVTFLFSVVGIAVLQAFQMFKEMTVINGVGGLVRLIFGAIGATFGVGLTLAFGVISNIAVFLMAFLPLRNLLSHKEKKLTMTASSALYYSIPAFIAVLTMTALYSQDVVLVKHFFSAQQAGIYSSLSVLGKIIFFASSSIAGVAFPILAERKELGRAYDKVVFLSILAVALMSFGLTAGYYIFPSFIVDLLFGKAFASATLYLGPFGLFISFYTLSNLFITIYLALGKTNVWIFAAISALAQVVVMNMYHTDLMVVIRNNTFIVGGLFVLLLLYYPYAKRKS